jgi:hypothetical protein
MRQNVSLPQLLLVMTFLALLLQPAGATPYLRETGCDSVTVGGVLVHRVTFELNYDNATICGFGFNESTGDPNCRILACSSPPGWECGTNDGLAGFGAPPDTCYSSLAPHDGFSIDLAGTACCFHVVFWDSFPDHVMEQTVCPSCTAAVPARSATWGVVKSLYR